MHSAHASTSAMLGGASGAKPRADSAFVIVGMVLVAAGCFALIFAFSTVVFTECTTTHPTKGTCFISSDAGPAFSPGTNQEDVYRYAVQVNPVPGSVTPVNNTCYLNYQDAADDLAIDTEFGCCLVKSPTCHTLSETDLDDFKEDPETIDSTVNPYTSVWWFISLGLFVAGCGLLGYYDSRL